MRVVSLFSGAGGLDLGLISAGMEVVWANDIFADAIETYRQNISNHKLTTRNFYSLWNRSKNITPVLGERYKK